MQWSDVVAPPKATVLRQFAGLWLLFFVAVAAWRAWHGDVGLRTEVSAAAGVIVGGLGLLRPIAIRWVYTGCMIAAFPIGFVVSQVMLAVIFYAVFTPVALFFKVIGRDSLSLRRRSRTSYWTAKPPVDNARDYLRQS
jgi:hypothetical protein